MKHNCDHTTTGYCISCVLKMQEEIRMLRECNEQLVVSEQSIRVEANNLRRELTELKKKGSK